MYYVVPGGATLTRYQAEKRKHMMTPDFHPSAVSSTEYSSPDFLRKDYYVITKYKTSDDFASTRARQAE